MEKRTARLIVGDAGGTAANGSKTYKVSIPSAWINRLGVGENRRTLEMMFDGERITLSPPQTMENYVKEKLTLGHDVRAFRYYDNQKLCTLIYADFSDKTLKAENYTDNIVKTAFGNRAFASWADLQSFLEERCIPRGRSGLREYLEAIGVDGYDPLEIIKKTSGQMTEDQQRLEMEALT